jgi:hypothetical protein
MQVSIAMAALRGRDLPLVRSTLRNEEVTPLFQGRTVQRGLANARFKRAGVVPAANMARPGNRDGGALAHVRRFQHIATIHARWQ